MYISVRTLLQGQQNHGAGPDNMVDLMPPQPATTGREHDTIPRWEDDGGSVFPSDATEIQIFGPAEAKYELLKHLESEGLAGHIVSLEEAGTLTDPQIAATVQKRFPIRSHFDLSPE